MTLVFDTSVLSSLFSNDDRVVRSFSSQTYDRLLIPLATDAEMRFGFAHGSKQTDNLKGYELFKQQFDLVVTNPDQDIAIVYADLAAWARKHGVALSHNDFWIAATCIQVGGVLATFDKDFKQLPQIRIANIES